MPINEKDRFWATFGTLENRKWLLGLMDELPDAPQGTIGTQDVTELPPDVDAVTIKTEDITERFKTEGSQDLKFRKYRLDVEDAEFDLFVGEKYVELAWEGGAGIPFNQEALHKIVFEDLSAATNTSHLISTWADPLSNVRFLEKRKGQAAHIQLDLGTAKGRASYDALMNDPARIQWIRYDVIDPEFGHLYSFGMDFKSNSLRAGRMLVGLPKEGAWTDPLVSWAAVHHKDDALMRNRGIVPPLTGVINRLRTNAAF